MSKYFRIQKQIKPFSHIVMEIFKEVACKMELANNCYLRSEEDIKAEETDSGRSSDNCERDKFKNQQTLQNLKLIRDRPSANSYGYEKHSTIGFAGIKNLQVNKESKSTQLIVRRRNRGELQKRKDFRRNTIDVNKFDLEKASKMVNDSDKCNYWNNSKSMNYLHKLHIDEEEFAMKINRMRLCDGISMPDVNTKENQNSRISHTFNNASVKPLTKSYSEESFLIQSKGPEFVLKSNFPSRELELIESKIAFQKTVHVLLLNGQSLYIKCDSIQTTSKEIFETVVKSENYIENFFLGLCALIGGDFVFLPADFKIYKVAPQNWLNDSKKFPGSVSNVFFTLFLRIKFFLPNLRGVSSLETRHMLYLQLRKSILEKLILCSDDDLIILGGLALQAEMGDFMETMKYTEYFKISYYLPDNVYCRNKEMAKYLRNSHYCRRGLQQKEAEHTFIKYIQEMKEYGYHLYSAEWDLDDQNLLDIYVGISLRGISLFERSCDQISYIRNSKENSSTTYHKKLLKTFEWLEIENLCFSKHILCIVVRKPESLKAKDNNRIKYKLRMDDKKSYFAFSLASEHHQFYMRLRNSFTSLKSISDELNIPVTLKENLKDIGEIKQTSLSEIQIKSTNSNSDKNSNTNLFRNPKSTKENLKDIDKHTKDYTLPKDFTCLNAECFNNKITATANNPIPIEREKTTKKSMLNDNRLLKLKEKFLRRSKSSAAGLELTVKKPSKKSKEKSLKNEKKEIKDCGCTVEATKEECQNKENECPAKYVLPSSPLKQRSIEEIASDVSDEQYKMYSPNRNRVKMGTRVFSSQFLNKSYDNIYDRFKQFNNPSTVALDIDGDSSREDGGIYDTVDCRARINNHKNGFKRNGKQFDLKDDKNIAVSNTSTSMCCLYCKMDKDYSTKQFSNSVILPNEQDEAYVIDSSIASDLDYQIKHFSLNNETISDSLLEKLNNITNTSNSTSERILKKITVTKETIQVKPYERQNLNPTYESIPQKQIPNAIRPVNNSYQAAVGNISKYATFSPGKMKFLLRSVGSIDCLGNHQQIAHSKFDLENESRKKNMYDQEDFKNIQKLSKSQDSIFFGNKFSSNVGFSEKEDENSFSLGISIIQGSKDNNVYVKDLIRMGPGDKAGIQIGDQIIAVNGISLLNLSYNESLKLLQNTGRTVELIVSQIIISPNIRKETKENFGNINYSKFKKCSQEKDISLIKYNRILSSKLTDIRTSSNDQNNLNRIILRQDMEKNFPKSNMSYKTNKDLKIRDEIEFRSLISSSDVCTNNEVIMKNKLGLSGHKINKANTRTKWDNASPTESLPKVVSILPKEKRESSEIVEYATVLRKSQRQTNSQSKRYLGPTRYPVTPKKPHISNIGNQQTLSVKIHDQQVLI